MQDALLGAYRDFGQFRGGSEGELLAWLRQILINCLHHAYETHIKAGRRDLRREVSLDDVGQALDRSALRLGQCLADRGHSPSAPVMCREWAVEIANQLAKLRPDYREVIVLRNLQGLSFEEVAERMERKPVVRRACCGCGPSSSFAIATRPANEIKCTKRFVCNNTVFIDVESALVC